MKLLLDELFSPAIVRGLRARGIDAVSVHELSDAPGDSDERVLSAAAEDGRVVVTEDVNDFLRLDREWRRRGERHAGIVLVSQRHFSRNDPRHIGMLVDALNAFCSRDEAREPGFVRWLS